MPLGLKDAIFGGLQAAAGIGAIAATGGAAAPLVGAGLAATAAQDIGKAQAPAAPAAAPPPPPPPAAPPPQMSSPGIAGGAAPGAGGMPQLQQPQFVTSDERRKTRVQSGTEDIKRFLSHFSDSALTPPAPVRSDARAKNEAYAMGQVHGQREATARWSRFAPGIAHNDIGPTGRAPDMKAIGGHAEGGRGLAFQGGMPSHVQAQQALGQPLPAPVQSGFPGHGEEVQARASGASPDNAPWVEFGDNGMPHMVHPGPAAPQQVAPAQMMPPMPQPAPIPDDERQRQLATSDRNLKTDVRPAERSIKDFLTQVYKNGAV